MRLIVHANRQGRAGGIIPFNGEQYTAIMHTEPLMEAIDAAGYDISFKGDRLDPERGARLGALCRLGERGQLRSTSPHSFLPLVGQLVPWLDRDNGLDLIGYEASSKADFAHVVTRDLAETIAMPSLGS